jgi:hypothetical protein
LKTASIVDFNEVLANAMEFRVWHKMIHELSMREHRVGGDQ